MPAPAQLAYQRAEARLRAVAQEVEALAAPLSARLAAGEISEDEWADSYAELEARLGWHDAHEAREVARDALLAWGLAQTRRLWAQHGRLFPGRDLAEVEALFAHPRAHRRLARLCLRLEVGA